MSKKQRLVVVGNGMAGARFVEELVGRGGGAHYEIVMFGDEPYGNYNRILLSSVLTGSHDATDIFINPLAWYRANAVTLHAGVRVNAIDTAGKQVVGSDGNRVAYDQLVIATGSNAFVPPMAGVRDAQGKLKQGVFVFRTLEDCNAILARAPKAKRAVVIGGGLLGLEAARGLLAQGLETHIVHLESHLMEVQLDAEGAGILQAQLEGMGLKVHLRKTTTEVLGDESVTGLHFAGGETLDCDLVVVSAGIRANTQLAKEAGLKVERGIVVGDDLAVEGTTDIYALGECAQHRGKVYGLVAPLWEQAQVLADRLS
ncbi:MAG: NAD(P)/FAD-dependent oxidoreductase, partial [Myxococcaceae bacterium]